MTRIGIAGDTAVFAGFCTARFQQGALPEATVLGGKRSIWLTAVFKPMRRAQDAH
jgi:hypothetical protein